MNRHVHEELTREWAVECGFTEAEAEAVARWDWSVDVAWPGRPWRNKRFHHLLWGGPRLAEEYFAHAVRTGSVPHLGVAIHIRQDVIGHGFVGSLVHWPAMDRWESRSEAVRARLQSETKQMLCEFSSAREEFALDESEQAERGGALARLEDGPPLPEV